MPATHCTMLCLAAATGAALAVIARRIPGQAVTEQAAERLAERLAEQVAAIVEDAADRVDFSVARVAANQVRELCAIERIGAQARAWHHN